MLVTLTFALHRGDGVTRRMSITQDKVTVGRDPQSHLWVDDELVLPKHAVMNVVSVNDITLMDLGGKLGTKVNGGAVDKCRVRPGDRIEVGETLIVLESAREAELSSVVWPDGGDGCCGLTKSGPDVNADDVEVDVPAVEVMVMWGGVVLHVSHLSPPRSFYVGEEQGAGKGVHFIVPSEKLGMARVPIVLVRQQRVALVLLPGATGVVESVGGRHESIGDLIASGVAEPCVAYPGAYEVMLPSSSKARMEVGGTTPGGALVFFATVGRAGRNVSGGLFTWWREGLVVPFVGSSLVVHVGLLVLMSVLYPDVKMMDRGGMSEDHLQLIRRYLKVSVREIEFQESERRETARKEAERAAKDKQRKESEERRWELLRQGAELSMVSPGLLNSANVQSPWEQDEHEVQQGIFGVGGWRAPVADAFGDYRFGLPGMGETGDGGRVGIDLDIDRALDGRGGSAARYWHGLGQGRLEDSYWRHSPRLRSGNYRVIGRLPSAVVQRIVRQNYGRFRWCYENGLRNRPNLHGRVTMGFVIGRDGAVSIVRNMGTDLDDMGVIQCVRRAYHGLSFPQPEIGIVTVIYPIYFSPE